VWRPIRKVIQPMCQVPEIVARMAQQLRDIMKLISGALDGVAQQTTRVRARSQMEWAFGPLTFSISSGVIFARPGGEMSYSAPLRRNLR